MNQETKDALQNLGFVVVEATKHGYRQIGSGDVVSFKIHPNDLNLDLLKAPLKTSLVLAIAETQEGQ